MMNKPIHLIAASLLLAGSVFTDATSHHARAQVSDADVTSFATENDPPDFDTAEDAVEAMKKALQEDTLDSFVKLLGLDADKLKASEQAVETYGKIKAGAAQRVLLETTEDTVIVEIGNMLWPLPFPVTKDENGKWAFDTYAGFEEIINRRVGENELETIATMRAYVEAQRIYAQEDRDGDGVLEYAQKLISSDGLTDGLYWPASVVAGTSPAGNFASQDAVDKAQLGGGYYGYHYKILRRQGDAIAGGAHDFIINGNMIAGFGLIAWPVDYSESGLKTFVVSHHGAVYEADLGLETEKIVSFIDSFNPDDSWEFIPE